MPKTTVVKGPDEVERALKGLTLPVVVKVVSPDILHKSDAGGVRVNLRTADEVRDAIRTMSALPKIKSAHVEGWLIEEMAPAGQEMVIGGLRDPQFGPLVMVGLGGIFVEVLADVSFRICPITRLDAEEMIDELKGAAILKGARGRKPVSREAIVDVLLEGRRRKRAADAARRRDQGSGHQSADRVRNRRGRGGRALYLGNPDIAPEKINQQTPS